MKCTNCGAELYPGDRFCMRCGARIPEEPAPVVQPEHPEAQPPPPPVVEAERLQAQPPPPPPPVFVAPQPAAPPPKKGSRRKWVIVGVLGLLAVACVLAAFSGSWLLGQLFRSGELSFAEPTSTPRPTATRTPVSLPTATQQPVPSPTVLPATPTTAPAPTAQGGVELFSCTSADSDCGWEAFSGTYGDVSAVGPELLLVARNSGLVETEIPGVSVQDFYLHFLAKLTSQSDDVGYSAAFRCDPQDSATFSYEFELRGNGEYRVWVWKDGDPNMLESGTTDVDPSGEDSIEIVAHGPSVSFLVNGQPVSEMTDAELREGPIYFIATVYEDVEVEVAISEVTVQTW